MTKRFFTANVNSKKYRVFLEDVHLICKRIKRTRPALPLFSGDEMISRQQTKDSSNEDLNDLTANEIVASK
jgi:hypothetical protein